MQSTALQNELQPETESRNSTPCETNEINDITVTEEHILNLKT